MPKRPRKQPSRITSLLIAALVAVACATTAPPPAVPSSAAATAPLRSAPVIVVGSGLTGLTVAYELEKAGIEALVVESAPRIGGRIQTVTFTDGATAEGHMEEYFARNPAYPLLQELGLPLIEDVAHSSVRIDGKIYPYRGEGDRDTYLAGIFDDSERAAWMTWNAKMWKLYTALHESHYAGKPLPPELVALTKVSLADFVAADHLPHRVSEWIRVTVEPEMAVEWDQISALDGVDEFRLFLDTPDGFGEKNYHVKGGNSNFTRALASHLRAGHVLTGTRVTAVAQDANGVTLRALVDDSRYVELRGKLAVVTVPISQIGRIQFEPALSEGKRKAIGTTRMGSYIKVHFRLAPGAEKLWTIDGENALTLLSDSHAGSIYDVTDLQDAEKPNGEGLLTLLLHARYARDLMNLPADEIRERTADALEALFPGVRPLIRSAEIFVYPQAVAYWPLELGRSRFDELADELRTPQGRVYIGGDTTEDSHSEGAVVAALRMSRAIAARRAELH
jgi:monoamine oxidase